MIRKLTLWLPLMAVLIFTLHSCVHDEVYSNSEFKEYTNKSLWKEDEKYIKNVKNIFEQYEDKQYFASNFGTVYWDYATTMGTYNENILEVPVLKDGKINFILLVYRENDRIFFKRKEEKNSLEFFASLVFTDRIKNRIRGRILNNGSVSKSICYTMETTVEWTNDDGSAGPTFSFSETHCVQTGPYLPCQAVDINQTCGNSGSHGGSGGGGNNGYPYPQNTNQDIITTELSNYPCAQGIAQQLPNLQNNLASAMRQIFANNKNYNITFKPKTGLGNIDGETFSTASTEFNNFNVIINLNDQVLLNATKEYILVTMYHEVIHAFLRYEKFRLGEVAFHEQYPGVIVGYDYAQNGTIINRFTYVDGHQQLIPFLTTLQNILSQYNPNLPHDVIVAMSRAGITTLTPEQSELNTNERNTLLGKNKGTKCP